MDHETLWHELEKARAEARAWEQRYRTLFERANDAFVLLDETGVIVDVNERWLQLIDMPRSDVVGHHFSRNAVARETEQNQKNFENGLAGSNEMMSSVLRPDGTELQFEFSTSLIEVDGKKLVLAIGRNVSPLVRIGRQLAASEGRYRRLVENMFDTAFISELETSKVLFMGPNISELTGFTATEISEGGAEHYSARIHPDDQASLMDARTAMRAGGVMDVEYRYQHKDGSWRWLRTRARSATRDGIAIVEGLISDTTQRRKLEGDLRQAQRMEAVAMLTGGVAHDFNNLLCVILAHSQMLLRAMSAEDPRREDVSNIREAGERAAALTRQLLAFSRKQVLQPKLLDVPSVLGSMGKLLRRLIGEDIELTVSADNGTAVIADAGQLEQVLMNLAVNARDAMPAGGELRVTATRASLKDGDVERVPAGDWLKLSVADTGTGMDEATRVRIFEPFFTTKPLGKGTGLGLSTCYGIVEQSGGFLTVQSKLGVGSTFTVYLPLAKDLASPEVVRGENAEGGSEKVLVVEDDPGLRHTLTRGLNRLGYEVIAAGSGQEAQALFGEHRDVKLVLSDMVMPGLNGLETIEALRAASFEGAVLMMSGYIDRPALQEALMRSQLPILQKPFRRETLAKAVRERLDSITAPS